jgi:hypothetical protein
MDQVIERMRAIDAALPPSDGVACFNRMYLQVTEDVRHEVAHGSFGDSGFVTELDVVFANLYFAAVDSLSGPPTAMPVAWQPLLTARHNRRLEPIQFALAGMNAHINHDLPLAVVSTCRDLATSPEDGTHHADYQLVDGLLDRAEQAVREGFEPADVRVVDQHMAAIANVVANWSITAARDEAWNTAVALWDVRDHPRAVDLLTSSLARTVAMVSRGLLVDLGPRSPHSAWPLVLDPSAAGRCLLDWARAVLSAPARAGAWLSPAPPGSRSGSTLGPPTADGAPGPERTASRGGDGGTNRPEATSA